MNNDEAMNQALPITETILRPCEGGCEATHFAKVELAEGWEAVEGDEDIVHGEHGLPRSLAVAKFFIPFDPQAPVRQLLPLADEAGLVQAFNQGNEAIKIPVHVAEALMRGMERQPFSSERRRNALCQP